MNLRRLLSILILGLGTAFPGCSFHSDTLPAYIDPCRSEATRSCGTNVGTCTIGEQTCIAGIWSSCSGTPPSDEICDYQDNDCDGDVDEGYMVGSECTLVGGCPGKRVCNRIETHSGGDGGASTNDGSAGSNDGGADAGNEDVGGTHCEIDTVRVSPEVCDGLDNDCDGFADYSLTGFGLQSACACERRTLAFSMPNDLSIANAEHLCAPTLCEANAGMSSMTFCLACGAAAPAPYALCESSAAVDLSSFDGPSATGALLEVNFTFTSKTATLTPINLWYQTSDRKRLPLLRPGDAAGSYSKIFVQANACLGKDNHFGEPGQCAAVLSGKDCADCAPTDSCGEFGGNCALTDFSASVLQVAAEFCPAGVQDAAGRIDIQQVNLISRGCLQTHP